MFDLPLHNVNALHLPQVTAIMKLMRLLYIFLLVVLFLYLAPSVSAQGLVPCGTTINNPCTLCDFFVLFENIINFVLWKLVPPLAVLMIVIGGAMFILGAGDPRLIERGKTILTSVIYGLAFVYGAWLIVNLFFTAMGVASWTGLNGGWFKINCGR